MFHISIVHIVVLCAVAFFVSMVGVVTGGHSMITVPLLMFFGLPPASAVATNRFSTLFLNISGSSVYLKNKKINIRFVWPFILSALIGAFIGSNILMHTGGVYVRTVIGIFILLLVIVGIIQRERGMDDIEEFVFSPGRKVVAIFIAFLVGVYWGFFGGGGMTLFTLFLTFTFGLSFLQSVGTSNLTCTFASIVAVLVYALHGAIYYTVAIAMALAMGLGAWIGSYFSIRIGNKWVKRIFTSIIIIFAIKLITGWPDMSSIITHR